MTKRYRVTFVRYYYQDVIVDEADDPEAMATTAREKLSWSAGLWEPSGDSRDIDFVGIELVPEES